MYIQITNRCQMTCAHCCYDCKANGEDMTLETFRDALQVCEDNGDTVFLGGGEPTLHPKFEKFLFEAIGCAYRIGNGPVSLITNGGFTKKAMTLAAMSEVGIISASLSRDQYHDNIDYDVVQAFESMSGYGRIWDTSNHAMRDPMPHGRAIELMGWDEEEVEAILEGGNSCICSDYFMKPNGDIHQCGCSGSPKIGDTTNGIDAPSQSGECFRSKWFIEACLEEEYEHLIVA